MRTGTSTAWKNERKQKKKWFPDSSVVSEGVSPASAKHVANTCKTFTAVHIFVFVCFSWMNQNRTKWMKYVWDGRMVTVRRLNRLWLVPACLKLSKSNSTRDNLIWPANWHPVKSRQPSFHEGNDSESKPEGNSRSKQPWYALGLCIFFEIGSGFGVHQRHIGRRMPSQTWRPRICLAMALPDGNCKLRKTRQNTGHIPKCSLAMSMHNAQISAALRTQMRSSKMTVWMFLQTIQTAGQGTRWSHCRSLRNSKIKALQRLQLFANTKRLAFRTIQHGCWTTFDFLVGSYFLWAKSSPSIARHFAGMQLCVIACLF